MNKDQLFEKIINSLKNEPNIWKYDGYKLIHPNGTEIWVANMGWSYLLVGMNQPHLWHADIVFSFWQRVKLMYACQEVLKNLKQRYEISEIENIAKLWRDKIK